ncbi:hypothetical protein BDAP_000884 [Binucleata daphniae]
MAKESARITKVGDVHNIFLGGQFLCFTKTNKALVVCNNKEQKGAKWKIEKHSNGYVIKNDKKTGFMFWNKEYCLEADEELKIDKCQKKSKKQLFKIKDFYTALGKDSEKQAESETEENVTSSSSSSETTDIKDGETPNTSKRSYMSSATSSKSSATSSKKSFTSLQSELIKIDHKDKKQTNDNDALAITNNKNGAPSDRLKYKEHENLNEDEPQEQASKDTDSPTDGPDVDNISSIIEQNENEKPKAFKGTDTKKETDLEGFIADSFEPITPEKRKKYAENDENEDRDKNDDILGVSKNIKNPKFNPIKAAALNLLMGVDAYLGDANGAGSMKVIGEDEIGKDKLKSKKPKNAKKEDETE